MKHILALTLLLSFNAFAHDGQEGNGPVLNVSMPERQACMVMAREVKSGLEGDLITVSYGGESHYFSRELLKPKCCAVGIMNCMITD